MQALLCGYYGFGNAGDEALLATLLQMLPSQIEPVVLSGNPAYTQTLHGVKTCDRNQPLQVLKTLWSSQAFIWGGGSLIQDGTSALSPLYYLGLMTLAQWRGLTTIAWAQGIGPLCRPWIRWMAGQVFRRCTAISVRDRASATLIAQWGLCATLAPDPVWALQNCPGPDLSHLSEPRVAIMVRPHPLLTPEHLERLTQALIQFQAQTQASLILLPLQPSQDLALAQGIASRLPQPSMVIQVNTPASLKGLLANVDLAISMRLHGLIMAAAEGCPCFALSYDPKVSQLMAEMPCPGWELSALPDSQDILSTHWQDLLIPNLAQFSPAQSYRTQAMQHQQLLFKVFKA
ncbi:polysaccharide pyruvyl transferase CsaB [Synechococcales cyanobacterium C]|uniref:Polysaccharide pyruvyl transferase CsaB n=1 Tax=Petrachloros mirabilis ULC683 TaxID=2781853 RepID=A0A8K2A267_9CYAN|nr:polysaccharide pyruvyl transferase CsaB [Petrachloros mirabilis ULC683]